MYSIRSGARGRAFRIRRTQPFTVSAVALLAWVLLEVGLLKLGTAALCSMVAINELTKQFFWSPHQQTLNLLTPTLTILIVRWILARQPSGRAVGFLGTLLGAGSLVYGNVLITLAGAGIALIVQGTRRGHAATPVSLRQQGPSCWPTMRHAAPVRTGQAGPRRCAGPSKEAVMTTHALIAPSAPASQPSRRRPEKAVAAGGWPTPRWIQPLSRPSLRIWPRWCGTSRCTGCTGYSRSA
jgi:hypothetical protein